jgi:hypothetical protein
MTDDREREKAPGVRSPYDRAARFQFAGWAICLSSMIGWMCLMLFVSGEVFLIFLLAFAVGLALTLFAQSITCPVCGKSVLVKYGFKKTNLLRLVSRQNRLIPERICSDCGTRLDASAPFDIGAGG